MIALKRNQPQAFQSVADLFEYIEKNNIEYGVDVWREYDKGHGRIEDRSVMNIDLAIYPLEALKKLSGIKSVARVNSVVRRNGEQTQEYRYYITSQSLDARKHGETISPYWAIENKLHYVLDVVFDEDANRSQKDHLARNFTTIRRVCMNLLRSAKVDKKTLKSTACKALMFPEFAFDLIRKSGLLELGSLPKSPPKKFPHPPPKSLAAPPLAVDRLALAVYTVGKFKLFTFRKNGGYHVRKCSCLHPRGSARSGLQVLRSKTGSDRG